MTNLISYFVSSLIPRVTGISFSDIALILPAAHKCAVYWPVSHATITHTRSSGTKTKPPLCKGRCRGTRRRDCKTHKFNKKQSLSQIRSICLQIISHLHKGAFDTKTLFANHLFVLCASAEPLLNHATIAWFSFYKKQRGGKSAALFE